MERDGSIRFGFLWVSLGFSIGKLISIVATPVGRGVSLTGAGLTAAYMLDGNINANAGALS